jgi:hypothetical protein
VAEAGLIFVGWYGYKVGQVFAPAGAIGVADDWGLALGALGLHGSIMDYFGSAVFSCSFFR